MRRLILVFMLLAGTALAGCEKCAPNPKANVNVNLGSGGVRTGVSVGQRCGPVFVRVSSGDYYQPDWY
ncbi:hypothetical protein [Psychromarinibacter sp. S121]|uniref:hypothetical protein n=1 Tax=Psychromarinibacter sp. S121 TaxID=3415127 RepID=UPI003C7B1EE6